MNIIELLNRQGMRVNFIFSPSKKLYAYIERCTLEAKHEFNFNTNAHRIEKINDEISQEELKVKFPQSSIVYMPSTRFKKFIFDYIIELETTKCANE